MGKSIDEAAEGFADAVLERLRDEEAEREELMAHRDPPDDGPPDPEAPPIPLPEVRRWSVTHWDKPWTLNDERARAWQRRHIDTREWREAFGMLARAEKMPQLRVVRVVALPLCRIANVDAGNHYPAVKAAIDGLVDAGVLPNDGPQHVVAITMLAPKKIGRDGLRLVILDAAEATPGVLF